MATPLAVASLTWLAGCAGQDNPGNSPEEQLELAMMDEALTAACGGDESNSLAAGLAVAVGNELGRWDVNTDFVVSNGKLELSTTGNLHCGSGCPKIKALLRLQDDAASVVPNHSPATYRTKLTTWYSDQKTALGNLVTQMLTKDQGVFRVRSKLSGKYIVPQNGSTSSGAVLEQSDQYSSTSAAQWRVKLQGVRQQLINIKSGMCMDLSSDNTTSTLVQRPCNNGATQDFRLGQLEAGVLTIRSKHNQALAPQGASSSNGADIVQSTVTGATAEKFVFEAYGSGAHRDLLETITAVYSLKVAHTGMGLAVSSSSSSDGVTVVQQPYAATDDRFHWYVTPLGSANINGVQQTTYQFMNRRTGKCLDLDGSSPKRVIQRTCSTSNTQRFSLAPTGNYRQVAYTYNGRTVDVQNASKSSGALLVEGPANEGWQWHNMITFEPILAIEPHRLTYSNSTSDGPCGKYEWYNIAQPNGLSLKDPASTYVQLIFAGGKKTQSGADVNPYIAQQVSGNRVAIDPAYGLNASSSTSTGSCAAACVSISLSSLDGRCCSCQGKNLKFKKSAWSASTFLCQ